MATKTPNISLNKPGDGEYGWAELLRQNWDVLDAEIGALNNERAVTGTATGGSATTLVDTSVSWGTDAWAGAIVVVRRAGALLRAEKVTTNTADTLTFASGSAVQAGDTYALYAQANAIPISEKGAANGVATLDANSKLVQMPTPADIGAEPALGFTPENAANKGVANGYASLDANGWLVEPFGNIPSNTANADLNTITTPGVYYCQTPTANAPTGASNYGWLHVTRRDVATIEQVWRDAISTSGHCWYRSMTGGTWNAWQHISAFANATTHDVTASRAAGVSYTNNTGKVMRVDVRIIRSAGTISAFDITTNINGAAATQAWNVNSGGYGCYWTPSVIIPPGGSYKINMTSNATLMNVWEIY